MRTLMTCVLTLSASLLLSACASAGPRGGQHSRPPVAANADADGDLLQDVVDKCPQNPEDVDGFEDQDGCPELDNDRDGVPDAMDKCPNEPMVRQPGVDPSRGQGCPDDLRPPTIIDDK